MKVSAIIVTRGDVDLGRCLQNIEADEIILRRGHGGVWERYEAAMYARHDVIYTQDDDCVVDALRVIGQYEPGMVTCNMPMDRRGEYRDKDGIALVGWGSVFDRAALGAFERYFAVHQNREDEIFKREADRVFTALNRVKLIEIPFEHLPYAFGEDRMGREVRHGADLNEIRKRISLVPKCS